MRRLAVIAPFMAAMLAGCASDVTAPAVTAITLTFDASTCSGSGPVDIFIDGAKVASATLTAGVPSQAFPVIAGSHVLSATATSTGSTWPSQQVTATAGVTTTFVFLCTNGRQLAPYTATLQNYLTLRVTVAGLTDTLAAATTTPSTKVITYVGLTSITWGPLPLKYSNGTNIPDDNMIGISPLTPGGTVALTATFPNISFFSFSFTNSTGVSVDLGVFSNGAFKCLATLPASTSAYRFGYYVLDSGSQVRYYKAGSACTGSGLLWDGAALAARDAQSGFIALASTIAP